MHTVRYSAKIRKLVNAAVKSKNARYECPKCGKRKVVRSSNAQWRCRSCGAIIAGGAYSLTTDVGEVANRIIKEMEKR